VEQYERHRTLYPDHHPQVGRFDMSPLEVSNTLKAYNSIAESIAVMANTNADMVRIGIQGAWTTEGLKKTTEILLEVRDRVTQVILPGLDAYESMVKETQKAPEVRESLLNDIRDCRSACRLALTAVKSAIGTINEKIDEGQSV
jgi:hypothetical protein